MNERAISPSVGSVLFVAITIIIVSVAGALFLGYQSELSESPRSSVDVEYDPGFSLHTHEVQFTVEVRENTDELYVKSPRENSCSGRKNLGSAGESVSYNNCKPGDRFFVVAETDSSTILIEEYEIPDRYDE